MSILSTSLTSTRHFDMNIAAALGDINAAVIVQQLNYWMQKEGVGVIIDGVKYIYNTFVDWVNSQFSWLSVWQFRKAMNLLRSLGIVKVIRYKSRQWNQTNYYTLSSDRLIEYLEQQNAGSTETVEMCVSTPQLEKNQTLEVRDTEVSLYRDKEYTKKETTEQKSDRLINKLNTLAAASPKQALQEEISSRQRLDSSAELTASISQKKVKLELNKSNTDKDKSSAQVDFAVRPRSFSSCQGTRTKTIVNKKWQELVPLLDSAGIPINKTVSDLLKLYPSEKVENAIALLKARKREKHIPNLSGYFVAALKGDWGSKILIESESQDGDRHSKSEEIDTAAIFRHWYDLARELGYCSGQEIREGQQWVKLSGAWEKWADAVKRGYSLDYLKKIIKRNQGR